MTKNYEVLSLVKSIPRYILYQAEIILVTWSKHQDKCCQRFVMTRPRQDKIKNSWSCLGLSTGASDITNFELVKQFFFKQKTRVFCLKIKVGVTKYTKVPLEKSDQFQKMAFYVLIRTSLYWPFYLEK